MAQCKECGVIGGYKYDIIGWHQDLADSVLIDRKTNKCETCITEKKEDN